MKNTLIALLLLFVGSGPSAAAHETRVLADLELPTPLFLFLKADKTPQWSISLDMQPIQRKSSITSLLQRPLSWSVRTNRVDALLTATLSDADPYVNALMSLGELYMDFFVSEARLQELRGYIWDQQLDRGLSPADLP